MATATVPKTIGKYEIISVVAQGGMGKVYRAKHPTLQQEVIIKELLLRKGSASIRERFKREAQILMNLTSPYVVRMFDYFSVGYKDYIVLELVDGMSLDKLIEKQFVFPPQLALLVFLDACYGLKNAHEKGIVHRDIKPGNILISRRAEIKLADFGIAGSEKEKEVEEQTASSDATQVSSSKDSGLTQYGTTLGTPAYMSPEQLDDSRSVDQRADIYSMGVMLYQMVTGSKPYAGDMSADTLDKIRNGRYIPPEKIDKSLPYIIRVLVKKMMQPDPNKRYQTIDPVIRKIKRYLNKYDRHAIRVSLAKIVISSKAISLPNYEPKNKYIVRILTAVLVAGLLIFAGFKGVYYRTILRPWYVPVTLQMQIPVTDVNTAYTADLPAKAFFFHNVDDIPEVSGINFSRVFSSKKKESNSEEGNVTLVTKSVSLKPGDYRIKIVSGPYILWKSFTVAKGKAQVLSFDFLKNQKRTLAITMTAQDYDTGEDISDSTQFQILVGNKWVSINSLKAGSVASGQVIHVRAAAKGYVTEFFGLAIDWYQDTLYVNASLHKDQPEEGSAQDGESSKEKEAESVESTKVEEKKPAETAKKAETKTATTKTTTEKKTTSTSSKSSTKTSSSEDVPRQIKKKK